MKYMVSFDSVSSVKSFVNIVSGYDYDFELVSGNYVLNAKSIMGIFSLDLSKPISLNIHADESGLDAIMETLTQYLV